MTPAQVEMHMCELAAAIADRPAALRPLEVVTVRAGTAMRHTATVWVCCRTHNGTAVGWAFIWHVIPDATVPEMCLVSVRVADRLGVRWTPEDSVPGLVADLGRTYGQQALGIEP